MGVKNKQRRAAKRRKQQARPSRPSEWQRTPPVLTPADVRNLLLDVAARIHDDSGAAARCASLLLAPGEPLTPEVARSGLRALLAELVRTLVTNGWAPDDLAQITRRLGSADQVPLVVGLLHDEARRHVPSRLSAQWSADLSSCGAPTPLDLHTVPGLQRALELVAVLTQLPAIAPILPAPGERPARSAQHEPQQAKLLARVQALLAKAEATEYAEEAEALSAKAQELVTRHALERLLADADAGRPDEAPIARRLWIDAPYVFAKSMLVHVVAGANRCRSVVSESLGFCTVVGRPGDLDAIELLVPSLLVQAHTAMSRCGRQTDRVGTSRTRSFRQSFLLSYAERIGERLRAADIAATDANARRGELVPVLRRHHEQLADACDALFPHLTTRAAAVTNAEGWAAGRLAADQALLGADQQLPAAG